MVAALTTVLLIPQFADSEVIYVRRVATTTPDHIAEISKMVGTEAQEAWLKKLEHCESSGNPEAINPEDTDGTPSYGLLQFKPSTFVAFSRVYKMTGELMDPEAQRAIVRRMMGDASVNWHQQFPACVRRLGLPPKTR